MLTNVRSFLSKVFAAETLFRALPVFIIIAGLVIFAAAYVALPKGAHPDWHDATKSLGQAILVSGVVSTLLSSLKYIGIFKEAVHDVMYEGRYLKTRTDLTEIWGRVTSAITQDRFPELAQELYPQILQRYIPSDKPFIYSRFERECLLDWHDTDNGIVNWVEEIEVTLIPISASQEIEYRYFSKTDSRTPRDLAKININRLEIDGVDRRDEIFEEEYDDDFGKKGLRTYYTIKLSGKDKYEVSRRLERKICLIHDPVMEYASPQFIASKTVKIRSNTHEIRTVFVGVGNDQFEDRAGGVGGIWSIHRELRGPLVPNQGYIIFIQRV